MAELKVQVQVVKQDALRDIQNIEQRLDAIEKNPVQIKFQVSGLEGTAQKMEQMASAQNRIATSASSAASASNSFASSQKSAVSAASQGAKQVDALASSYSKLGVTVANFAKYKAFAAITSGIRASVSEMKKLDDELVTVRKVTDATQKELDQITKKSYEVGSKYGKAPSDYAAGVAEFARAGYRETADELAELSIKSQLVGDMSATVANKFLLATDAAYGYNGSIKELSAVLDGMNAIDNNFATSIEKISTGLGKVAPIAAQAHVGVDELSAAIGTITAVTQRSGEEAATALRALFLNIMGDTKTEIEDGAKWTAGEIDGLRDILERYAPAAVAAAEATGQVINPMEAMRGLAQSMREGVLSEQELMQMVTDIGGKLRSSQLLAIVQRWDVYESMLSTYKNAAGSADAEISKMMDGWSFKAKQLKTSFTQLMSSFADSKTAKNGLDLLRGVVEVLDTDLGHAAISAAAFGVAASGAATGALKLVELLSNPSPATWIGLAVAGISLLYSGINELFPSYNKLAERAEEANKQYETEKTKLAQVNTELQTTNERIAELQGKGSLTLIEADELDRLVAARGELEQIKAIQEEITKDAQMQAAQAAAKAAEALGQYNKEAIQNEKEMFGNYALLYGDRTPQDDLFDPQNINSMVAAFESLTESKSEALSFGEDVTEFNDGLQKIKSSMVSAGDSYQYWIDQMKDYYESIKDLPESALSESDKLVRSMYVAAQDNLAVIQKILNPASYYEQNFASTEEAKKVSDAYIVSLEKQIAAKRKLYQATEIGSDEEMLLGEEVYKLTQELEKYNSALEEASGRTDEVLGSETAILLAQELGAAYNLSAEAVEALIQEIRVMNNLTSSPDSALPTEPAPTPDGSSGGGQLDGEEYRSLSETIDELIGKYNLLRQAMYETNATGLVSEETFKGLTDAGIDLGDVYKDDVTGAFKVSGDTIKDALYETEDLLNDLSGSDFDFDTEGLDEFDRLLKETMDDLSELERMLSSAGESGDLFREYQDNYAKAMELLNDGRTGTNAFAAYSRSLFNDEVLAEIGNDAEKMGAKLQEKLISGMLDKSKNGAELAEFMAKNFEGTGAVFEDLGDEIRTTIYDWEQFSKSTGLSEEVLRGLFGFIDESSSTMSDFGNEAEKAAENVEATADSLDEMGKSAQNAEKADLKDVGNESKTSEKQVENLTKRVDELEKALKNPFELGVEVKTAEENIQKVQDANDQLIESEHYIEFTTNASTILTEVEALHAEASDTAGTYEIKFKITTEGSIPEGFATGTKNAPEGPAIVNEEGPELIVSHGRAYIADDGRPTMVDLHAGDIVYTHEETKDILNGRGIAETGIDAFASGTKPNLSVIPMVSNVRNAVTTTTPKPKPKPSSGGGGSSRRSSDEKDEDWWSIVEDWFGYYTDQNQRAIDRLSYQIELLENGLEDFTAPLEKQIDQIERLNDQIDRQVDLLERQQEALVKPIQDEIDALEKAKEIQDEQLELAEKQKAVEEARNELQNAQNERTIRYFNEQKGQWEWMADKGAVADAQTALEEAEKELADFEYEMHIRDLERQIENIEDVYEAKIGELEEQQTANDDLIYDLEQQILAAEDAYNAAIEPLEKQVTELERQLKAIEEAWAEAEMPYIAPEDDLSKALSKIGGTSADLAAVKAAIESIKSASKANLTSTKNTSAKTVSIEPTQSTQTQYGTLLAEMGVLFGASNGSADTSSYNTSNVNTVYDYSGAITIGGITITGDPNDITLADLIDDVGIYVQR